MSVVVEEKKLESVFIEENETKFENKESDIVRINMKKSIKRKMLK